METALPVVRFCSDILRDALALSLPGDPSLESVLCSTCGAINSNPLSNSVGPTRTQIEAAVAALSIWLDLYGKEALREPSPPLTPERGPVVRRGSQVDAHHAVTPASQPPASVEVVPLDALVSEPSAERPTVVIPTNVEVGRYPILNMSLTSLTQPSVTSPSVVMSPGTPEDTSFEWGNPDLPTTGSVDTFMAALEKTPSLATRVRRLDLRPHDALVSAERFGALLHQTPRIESLLLAASPATPLSSIVLDCIIGGDHNPKLTSLVIQSLPYSVKSMSSIGEMTPAFMGLKDTVARLEVLSIDLACVDADFVHFISSSPLPTLKKLHVHSSGPHTTQDADVLTLVERATSLEVLNFDLPLPDVLRAVAKLPRIRALNAPASEPILVGVLTGCPLLEDLALHGCPDAAGSGATAAELTRHIAAHAQSLRNLSVDCPAGANAGPMAPEAELALSELLERRGRSLRGLRLAGWRGGDRVLRAVAKHCIALDALALAHAGGVRSEAAVREVVAKCRALRWVEMGGVMESAEAAVRAAVAEVEGRGVGRRGIEVGRVVV